MHLHGRARYRLSRWGGADRQCLICTIGVISVIYAFIYLFAVALQLLQPQWSHAL